jgi:uncharacterized protein YbbK (DUF523 family)
MTEGKLRLGVSACLMGEPVRYDGGHKRDPFLTETLAPFVEWVPVCPELEIGLGVPRDTLRLVGEPRAPRLVVERTGEDLTPAMQRFVRRRLDDLAALELDGYVLKRASPSCGLFRVRVYGEGGVAGAVGRGIFASALVERFPALPVKRRLDVDERVELREIIEEYRQGLVPLVVPLTLIRHHVRRLAIAYLREQVYLSPHPKELMLRNHV